MEYKFRGKDAKTGEWVYGYFIKDAIGNSRIVIPDKSLDGCAFLTITNGTDGQFTGIVDVTGLEVYAGDIRCIYGFDFEILFSDGEFIGFNGNFGTIRSEELRFTRKTGTIHDKVKQ